MNRTHNQRSINQPEKRGALARKLLQVAKRKPQTVLPVSSLLDDNGEPLPGKIATVLGPYCNGSKWRLVIKDGDGRKSFLYDTEQEALAVRAELLIALVDRASRTLGDTVDEYLEHKRKRGCCERTIRTTRYKLLPFLPAMYQLSSIKTQTAERLYVALVDKTAVSTHHLSLRNAKEFFRYCIKQKYLALNPFAGVQPIGKANVGKPQLRQDEARKLTNYLVNESAKGDTCALALLVQVMLGLRSGEVLNLRKRDLDCGATIVVVDGTKNKNARRSLELEAPIVRELLLKRCEGLTADALIFARVGATRPPFNSMLVKALIRFCKRADVPIVCPHSLRGLHSSLAVKAGATSAFVAQALGHGSDAVTRKHYITSSALDSARSARVAGALLGDAEVDRLIASLRALPREEFGRVCSTLGLTTVSA